MFSDSLCGLNKKQFSSNFETAEFLLILNSSRDFYQCYTGGVTCFACLSKLAVFQNCLVTAGVCTDCTIINPILFIIPTFFLFLHEDYFFLSLTHLCYPSSNTHGCSHSAVFSLCNSYVMQSLNFCFQAYSLLLMSTQFKPWRDVMNR